MHVRSSGLVHSAESDIERLQQILRESYASGFTIFKELLQNAEDAGAKRLIVAGHRGFPGATNPLLQTPGLIVANDGPVFGRNMDGITRASGGSKADERSAVGRFGLGQKSVYHLCDAFIALGKVDDDGNRPRLLIMNPWEKVGEASVAGNEWPYLNHAEGQMLLDKVAALGLNKGMALFLPLRTGSLRPGKDLCLSDRNWEPDSAIAEILQGAELAAALCCLRNLEVVEILPIDGEVRRFTLGKGARRLSGPGVDAGDAVIAGHVDGTGFALSFTGRQQWVPDGEAARLLGQDGWDKVFDIHRNLIAPKANPHGAVIVCRSSAKAGEGVLRVRDTVYLPLGEPVMTEPLGEGTHDIDLLVHGYFFVSSDRRKLRDDDHIESEWNDALRREASLPLLLEALADALLALPDDSARNALIRTLRRNRWWEENRADACQGRGLARCWPGGHAASWQVRPSASLRPVLRGDATSLARLKAAFPDLQAWCEARGIILAFGTLLADEDPRWPDAELAELVGVAGPAAFTKGPVAETLAALLDAAMPGPQTRTALAEIYRQATADVGPNFANAERLKPLVRHLPWDHILLLPPSVDNRELIRALAASGSTLPIKAAWASGDGADLRRIGLEETVDLLATIEPFLTGRGEPALQASALISHLLRNGPSLDALAANERARSLKVIPARRMQDDADERLSLGQIADLKRHGLLFDAAPNRELSILAAAIEEPAVYRVGLKDGGIVDLASAKKPECLLAVLRRAVRFDDPARCGELAEMLRDHAGRDELRRLVARDPHLPSDTELIELDRFDGVLDDLVDALHQGRQDRLVASPLAAELKKDVRQKVGLRRVDMASLGNWLQEAHDRGALPPIDDATAIALLKSGIDRSILEVLPLHKCEGGSGLHGADTLFIGRKAAIAPCLAPLARLAELWPDPDASHIQNRLIARWGPEAAIQTALSAANPGQFTTEICDALAEIDNLREGLTERLALVAWIAADGAEWRPGRVLDLPLEAEKALTELAFEQSGFVLASRLPSCIREQSVRERLRQLLPDRGTSYELAVSLAAEGGAIGICIDVIAGQDDLRRLARGHADLGGQAWPLLAAALRDDMPYETIARLAQAFPMPGLPTIISQMNAVAELVETGAGAISEAARRLHNAAFARNRDLLLSGRGYLPADLLIPNDFGNFLRADALALNAEGIAPQALLARAYAEGVGEEHTEHPPAAVPATGAPLDFSEGLAQAFTPLGDHDVGDGILLALAMLGRDENIRKLASEWEGQRSFDRICDDLDALADELRGIPNSNRERLSELRFAIEIPEDGQARVRSAAGSDCIVPLSGRGEALLLDCSYRGIERDQAGYRHVWSLVFGPVAPADENDAQAMLDQFARKLAPALMLAFDAQKQALSDLLASYFASDQRTLADTCAELKEVLHDRLRGIKPGPVMRAALQDYDRNSFRDRDGAREALWLAAQSKDGAAELLAATRHKIGVMGYEPHRTLFELYQNAVDAQAQWHGEGGFRVEVLRNADGSIGRLRVIHWGRPVNQPGGDPRKAEEEGHRRDLSNMLAINHSAKEGDAVTGRFGLGFKTVHMLGDEIRIASGGIAIRILGGMIPAAWSEGGKEVSSFNDRGRKATLIEIPVAADRCDEASRALKAFRDAAPLLAALRHRGAIQLVDDEGELPFRHDAYELAEGVGYLALDGGRYALCLELGEGFRLFLPFGRNGPHQFTDAVPQFWHLVPLVGERRRGAWLMEGRFPVDPGRTQFSSSAEDKEILFSRLGLDLGIRLVALHDFCMAEWANLARETGLDPAGRDDFWVRLLDLLALDLTAHGPEQALHGPGRGLARLLAERPLVPLAFGGAVCANEVEWHLKGAIADPALRNQIASWPLVDAFTGSLIDHETAKLLARLHLPRGGELSLGRLVENISGGAGIDPPLAGPLAAVLDENLRDALTGEEDRELRRILRERRWLAEDSSWQPIRLLAFPQSGDAAERARAAFAPPSGRLAPDYDTEGLKLAEFAREQAGHNEAVWQSWAETANSCATRETEFIRYLVDADQRTVTMLSHVATWFPPAAELAQSPLLDGLTPDERGRLLAKLGLYQSFAPVETQSPPELQIDAEAALLAIGDWWRDNRETLGPAYDRAVYPEDFSPTALNEGDDTAWFTMLAIASFHTLGRTKPGQSREFVSKAMQDGWWRKLAIIDPDDHELQPFVERLRAWSEPDAEESYLMWRRCLTDLCMIARHLDSYRRLFTKLPAIVAKEGEVSLRNHLRPAFSQISARMGVEAAPLARSLGIGANWLIRELSRHGFYSQEQADLIIPYGWSTAERVRRLFHVLRLGHFEHGIDQGRLLYQRVHDLIGDEVRFCGDGDLPFHIITLAKHRNALNSVLYTADVEQWPDDIWDDLRDDDA